MTIDKKNYFLSQYSKHISTDKIKKSEYIPFQHHAQLPALVDILSRKNSHHVLLQTEFSSDLNTYFLEGLLHYFSQSNVPLPLQNAELIYLDLNHLLLQKNKLSIESEFSNLLESLNKIETYFIFALVNFDLFSKADQEDSHVFLKQQFKLLLSHSKSRFIIFTACKKNNLEKSIADQFSYISFNKINIEDITSIIKHQCHDLEIFHQIIIPDEILEQATFLAKRYLSSHHVIEKTLLLLDSSAARTAIDDKLFSSKPVMSLSILLSVLSNWIKIPAKNLQPNKFHYGDFAQEIQQKIFSQDAAITLLGHALQNSQSLVQPSGKPFLSLLFAGPEHSGKISLAIALTEYLFKQTDMLYFVQPITQKINSILDLKLQSYNDKKYFSLKEIIYQKPYAVIMYENIHLAPNNIIDELQEILSTGCLYDDDGQAYHFHQMIILLSTTLGDKQLTEIAKSFTSEEESDEMNLLQLVMLERKHKSFSTPHYSAQEISDEAAKVIINHLPSALCQTLNVIPFLPLNQSAIEKIIRLNIKKLSQTLEIEHHIEMEFTPDVIHYLTNNALRNRQANTPIDINKTLKQFYFDVKQTILNQTNSAHRSQLFLQLNETGQILHCDWLRETAG